MTSLFTESFCNKIKMEGNLSLSSNLKRTMQTYLSSKIINYLKTRVIDYNYVFKEVKTDLLCSVLNSDYNMTLLENRSYKITTEQGYTTEFYNAVLGYNNISSIKKTNIKNYIKINCEEREKSLTYFCQDNLVCFYDESETKVEYYFQLKDYNILDFKVDENDFTYLLIEKSGTKYLAISHLTLDFVTLNSFESELKKESLITFLKVDQGGTLEKVDLDHVVLSSQNGLTQIDLCKRYYFFKDNKIFFNYCEDLEMFQDKFIDKFLQINHLNLYNYLNFLGLNDFKVDGKRKLSSFENETFKNIFKNKFDNTLNGGLNYFNSKKYNVLTDKKVDYKICLEDEYFFINGNFNYNFEAGNFIIEIDNYKAKLFKKLENSKTFLKEIVISPSTNTFYFCNLKFNLKKYELPLFKLVYNFSTTYPYTFKIDKKENFSLNKLYNNEKANNKKNVKIITRKTVPCNRTWFNGTSLCFNNIFDFNNKKFLYNNITVDLKRNESISLDGYSNFFTTKSYILKDNKIYLKEDGPIYLTTKKYVKIDLITENNYISDFWFDNQGKTILVKNTGDNIKIIEDFNNADYKIKIPYIKDFIKKSENHSEILDVNEEIVKLKYKDNILITDKFFDKPLYNKAFLYNVKDINTLSLFNSDGVEIFDYITDIKNNILEIYFNADDEKKYYCNYDDKSYIYLNVEKSQDDFKIQLEIDESGEKALERTVINKFSLNYDRTLRNNEYIELYLYDLEGKKATKLIFENSDLGKEIELNITCDYIVAEANFKIDFKNLTLNIVNIRSFIENNFIYFMKSYYADLLYITYKKENLKDYHIRKNLKVNTDYEVINNVLTESKKGNILIEPLNKNSIYIENLNKNNLMIDETIIYSVFDDEFFNKNFKTPGIIMINDKVENNTKIEKINSSILIGGQNELL